MFNKGDKVFCIDNVDFVDILKPAIYEVYDYSKIDHKVMLLELSGWFCGDRFVLIENNIDNEDLINHLAKEAFKLGSKDDKVLDIIKNLI